MDSPPVPIAVAGPRRPRRPDQLPHRGVSLARRLAAGLWLALATALTAQAGVPGADPAVIDPRERGNGIAVAIGGGLKADNEAIYARLVELAGGPGSRWVVLGTASADPLASAARAVLQLQRRGAQAVALQVSPRLDQPLIADAVRNADFVAQVQAAHGIFFTGGAQDRITDHLFPDGRATPLLQAIWAVYRGGGVVAGTSAGAAIMSTTMFRDAPDVLDVMKGRLRDGREVGRGLGFMGPALLVDQHFLKRGRLGRLLQLMQAKGYTWGLGVAENSAAVMRGDTVEIIGQALLVNLGEARREPATEVFSLVGARLSLLAAGDKLQLTSGELTPSPAKRSGQTLAPGTADYQPYYTEPPFFTDMLAANVIARSMGLLIDAQYDELRGITFDPKPAPDDPLAELGFEFRLYKGEGSMGWYTSSQGVDDYTVRDLLLDVHPIRVAQPLYAPWQP